MIWMMDLTEVHETCREYTRPREDDNSISVGWIQGHTKIGPVREVRVTSHLEQNGIEIQMNSLKK